MKKIIKRALILLCLLSIGKVYAQEEQWTEEELKGDNVIKEYRYRFYEEVEEGEYLTDKEENNYKYVDETKTIENEYSSWINNCDNIDSNELEFNTRYKYQELKPIRYMKIINTIYYRMAVRDISFPNTDITYSLYSCVDCTDDKTTLKKGGYMILKLSREVSIQELVLNINVPSTDTLYDIYLSTGTNFTDDELVGKINGYSAESDYAYDKTWRLFDNFTNEKEFVGELNENERYYKILNKEKVCRYKATKKYYYNILKVYFDDNYYKDVSDLGIPEESYNMYKKDLNDYKIYYRYKTDEELNNGEDNNIVTPINNIPVKTGIFKEKDYKYLVIYVLILILTALLLIKHMQNKSTKNNN